MGYMIAANMRTRLGALIVALAPAVMLLGLFTHSYIATLPDAGAVAAAVTDDTTRWGFVHLTVGLASGLLILAFLAIRSYLREAGEDRWSALALPFIIVGSTLFAMLPGMEFAPLAAAEVGGDVQAVQAALASWFLPMLVTGAVIFAAGVFAFAKGIFDSRVLTRPLTWLVVGALVVMAVARVVPLGAVQFYVQGIAGIVAFWPLAYVMWKNPEVSHGAAALDVENSMTPAVGRDREPQQRI